MGNAVERGVGYTPYGGTHFSFIAKFKANGDRPLDDALRHGSCPAKWRTHPHWDGRHAPTRKTWRETDSARRRTGK